MDVKYFQINYQCQNNASLNAQCANHTPSTTKQHKAQNVCTLGGPGARKIFIKELEQ